MAVWLALFFGTLFVHPRRSNSCNLKDSDGVSYSCQDFAYVSLGKTVDGLLSRFGTSVSVSDLMSDTNSSNETSWFVLVPGSAYNLTSVVNDARALGYSYVLVYDPDGNHLPLNNDIKNLQFPVVTLKNDAASSLEDAFRRQGNSSSVVRLVLDPGNYLLGSIAAVGATIGFLDVVTIACCICCTARLIRRATTTEEQTPLGQPGIQRLPTRRFRVKTADAKKAEEKAEEDTVNVCAICLDDFRDGDPIRVLPCEHYFHVSCIDQWLIDYACDCPLCKRAVPRKEVPMI